MKTILISLLPSVLILAIIGGPSLLIIKFHDYKNRAKKSPLNQDLLRNPGQSLLEKINDMTTDLMINIVIFPLIPCLLYIQLMNLYVFQKQTPSVFIIVLFTVLALGSIIYLSYKDIRIFRKRNRLRLAYECEVAVGQDLHNELNSGFRIFHDFPAKNFNIDHIAVGPTGVFAIETKGRSRSAKNENNNWEIIFNGKSLIFPGWKEQKPIEQSKKQAMWLNQWIKKMTFEEVYVTPVLAFPHWMIKRKASSFDVLIYNGKNSKFLSKRPHVLSEWQIEIISSQIEKECRNIKGKAYVKAA
jgi:hypothetical protein